MTQVLYTLEKMLRSKEGKTATVSEKLKSQYKNLHRQIQEKAVQE